MKNLEYLRKANNTFEFCRTKCQLLDSRLRNINSYPSQNRLCTGDCMNIRFELFNKKKPNNQENIKTFVWLAQIK